MIKLHRDIKRFMKFVKFHQSGCWIWTGTHSGFGRGGGYGRFSYKGTTVAAHRWIYEIMIKKIRGKTQLDHLCCNRGCVNPAHLEPVSCKENHKRRIENSKQSNLKPSDEAKGAS